MKSKPSPATSKSPRLRVGLKDVSREEFAAAVNERLGKAELAADWSLAQSKEPLKIIDPLE